MAREIYARRRRSLFKRPFELASFAHANRSAPLWSPLYRSDGRRRSWVRHDPPRKGVAPADETQRARGRMPHRHGAWLGGSVMRELTPCTRWLLLNRQCTIPRTIRNLLPLVTLLYSPRSAHTHEHTHTHTHTHTHSHCQLPAGRLTCAATVGGLSRSWTAALGRRGWWAGGFGA